MAEYKGYLLKINGTELPGQYIQDYSSTPNQVQDKDSYQDLTGELHREILPHTRSKIEFKTPPMSLEGKIVFQSFFPDRKSHPKISVEYWNDENNSYTAGIFYTPDITYQSYPSGDTIAYKPFRVALIEH